VAKSRAIYYQRFGGCKVERSEISLLCCSSAALRYLITS